MSKQYFIQKYVQKYVDELYEVVNKSDNQHYKIYAIMVYLKGRNVYSEKLYNDSGITSEINSEINSDINSVKLEITSAKLEDLVLSVKLGNEYKDKKIADELLKVENDNYYQGYSVYDLEDMKKSIEAYYQWIQIRIEEYGRERMLEQLKNMPIVQEMSMS